MPQPPRNPINWNFNVGPFAWLAAGVGTSMARTELAQKRAHGLKARHTAKLRRGKP